MPGLGFKSYLQVGREATYGSAGTVTHKFEIISEDLSPQIGVIRDPSLYAARSRRGLYQGGSLIRGKIKVRCNYEGLTMLWDWAFGAATFGSNGGATTGTNPYTHVFTEKDNCNSYTLEIVKGDVPTGKCFRVLGAKCAGLTITGTAGTGEQAMLTAEFDVVGKSMTSNVTPTAALNLAGIAPVLFHHSVAASQKDGSGDSGSTLRIRSFEVSMQSPLADDRFYFSAVNIDEPIPNDFLVTTWKFTHELITQSSHDLASAFTPGELQLSFTTGASAILTLHSGTCQLTSWSAPVSGYGILTCSTEWEGIKDSTDASALKLTNVNTKSAINGAY